MKSKRLVPAVTSLPQSPQAEADHRVRRYALTMTIRIVCFGLMMFIQPYGWYTWVLAVAAAVLPYIAVVFANAGSDSTETSVESPIAEIEALPTVVVDTPDDEGAQVITIQEKPQDLS